MLFKEIKLLEKQMDNFLDIISESVLSARSDIGEKQPVESVLLRL